MVEFTYRDYLRYHKYLKEKEIINYCNKIEEGKAEEVMITIRDRIARNERRMIMQEIKKRTIIIAKKMIDNNIKKEAVQKITGLSMEKIEELNK